MDVNVAVTVGVFVAERGGQRLEDDAELNEVVEDDPTRVGAVKLAE